jgi:hypothetical protein
VGDDIGQKGKFSKNLSIKIQLNPKQCTPLRFCPKSMNPPPGILAKNFSCDAYELKFQEEVH